ncbi:hybrid sensory histidine kinase in two-component regulatory system with EvgA [Rubripirellula tenax]|uniref:Hybrid sensory histidine kinase in two-component regulatory system with EvgA n=1 Tax=Rubripirellula tenax TaxID=2528015 RepID=A0A5C6FI11_9BACT|nr:hypothetical protein [Rubripirellula tenax]TWU59269.1 hybrid sensory histidine kinase in two-component regulatory system with EvgA [Rubripirellula tenax]
MHHVEPGHDRPSKSSRRASIVVLDAGPISLLTLAGVLDHQGYACICARNGASALEALSMGRQDLLVADVGDDAAAVLADLEKMRSVDTYQDLPAVLIADAKWGGLEKKTEIMAAPTMCLFKPIDPNTLIAVVDQILWMPNLVAAHRRRGSRPSRPGWVSL